MYTTEKIIVIIIILVHLSPISAINKPVCKFKAIAILLNELCIKLYKLEIETEMYKF